MLSGKFWEKTGKQSNFSKRNEKNKQTYWKSCTVCIVITHNAIFSSCKQKIHFLKIQKIIKYNF